MSAVDEHPIVITPAGIRIGSRELPLLSGAVHYWRLEPSRWGAVLDTIAALGFQIVETYIPWAVHERAPGHFDFGSREPARDLGRFLDEVHARGLYALVRPGPHINSELTDFGFPARVLADPKVQARTARDTPAWLPVFPRPFPIPSYASEAFYDEVQGWFDAVLPLIASRLHPLGPVVAVQVDNELSNFFRTSLYDLDYAHDAVAGYRRFLLERYGDLEGLNRAYGTRYRDLRHVDPPRVYRPADSLRHHLDWARHQSWAMLRALERLKRQMRGHLPERIPLFTNLPPGSEQAPFDLSAIERVVDQVGLDLYHTRGELRSVQRAGRSLSAQTRLPSCPEFGAGCFLTWTPTGPEDNEQATLAAAMYGVRSFNFYMLVDRERWYGSPIRRDGRSREGQAGFYSSLLRLFDRFQLNTPRRVCEAAVVRVRLYDRLTAVTSLAQPIPSLVLIGLGVRPERFARDGGPGELARVHGEWLEAWQQALHASQVDFDLADSDQDTRLLERYRLLFVPARARFDAAAARRLLHLARNGAWVVFGPEMPVEDLETGEPISWLAGEQTPARGDGWTARGDGWTARAVGRGFVVLVHDAARAMPSLLEAAHAIRTGVAGLGPDPTHIAGVRMPPRGEDPGLVWVMNTGPDPQPARVAGASALRDLLSGERLEGDLEGVVVRMNGRSVRLLEPVGEFAPDPPAATKQASSGEEGR